MSEVRISAESRTEFGKGAARRTRREGLIPAVLYGHGQEPRHLALPSREFGTAMKKGGANTLLTLAIDGVTALALPKAIQRDPLRRTIEHVDLLLVRRGEKVTVEVRVALVGEAAPGALVNQELTTLTVEAEATHIPESVEVSIEGLQIGASINAGDVQLPSGTTLVGDAEQTVVSLLAAPTAADVDAELSGAEADAGIERQAPTGPADAEDAS